MHITTADVISANGKITRGKDEHSHTWTSAEDWGHFQKLRDSFPVLVMGSGTYDAVRPRPEAGLLRIVLTRKPEKYQDKTIPGQLEFWNEPPKNTVKLLKKRGFDRALLVGGQTNTAFWTAGLVDEAYVTIEPFIFGKGQSLADGTAFGATLRLQSAKQLNKQGTLLLHYLVDKE